MFDWIIDLRLYLDSIDPSPVRRDQWAKFDDMKAGDYIAFACDPNMQEDMVPYREAFKKRWSFKRFFIWTNKQNGKWIIHFRRTV